MYFDENLVFHRYKVTSRMEAFQIVKEDKENTHVEKENKGIINKYDRSVSTYVMIININELNSIVKQQRFSIWAISPKNLHILIYILLKKVRIFENC